MKSMCTTWVFFKFYWIILNGMNHLMFSLKIDCEQTSNAYLIKRLMKRYQKFLTVNYEK